MRVVNSVCGPVPRGVGGCRGEGRQHIKTVTGRSHLVFHFTRASSRLRGPISFKLAGCCAGSLSSDDYRRGLCDCVREDRPLLGCIPGRRTPVFSAIFQKNVNSTEL